MAPHRLDFDQDASVGAEAHAILGDGRAKEITGELYGEGAHPVIRGPDSRSRFDL